MSVYLPPTAAPLSSRALLKGLTGIAGGRQTLTAFEEQVRQYFGSHKVLAYSSGRAAFRVILESLKIHPEYRNRRQVVLPAYTCPVLGKAVQDAGFDPVACDIEPIRLDYDYDKLEHLVCQDTLAVVHVHLFGVPQDLSDVERAISSSGALLLEDACQAMGSALGQHPVGSQGVMGFASLGPGKPLSLGGGGLLMVNSSTWLETVIETVAGQSESRLVGLPGSKVAWIRMVALNCIFHPVGWRLATWLGLQKMGDDERNWGYRLSSLSASQAASGLAALANLEALNNQRRENAQALLRSLQDTPGVECVTAPAGAQPGYLRFPIFVADLEKRDQIFAQLNKIGIGVGKMYRKTLPEFFPALKNGEFPGAEYVARHLLTLPVHPYITVKHLDSMTRIIRAIVE